MKDIKEIYNQQVQIYSMKLTLIKKLSNIYKYHNKVQNRIKK